MNCTTAISSQTRWGIILLGVLAGLLWAVAETTIFSDSTQIYLKVFALGFSSVVACTAIQIRSRVSWLAALAVLPFLALMTGWLRWNNETIGNIRIISVAVLWLYLLMPLLQVWTTKKGPRPAAAIVAALWGNSFALLVTALATGVLWLLLVFWSGLFNLIGIKIFEWLFFKNDFFPPIATGAVIAAGIVLSRQQIIISQMFRRLITLLMRAMLMMHALVSLLFLASLPFTGLAIIPEQVSSTVLLTSMAVAMMIMTAMVCSGDDETLNSPLWLHKIVVLAQWLAPVFAGLACYTLGLRVAQYGWTVDRVTAAVMVALALLWTFACTGLRRKAWQKSISVDQLTATMLALSALCWLLLHSPVIDPYRISINNQLSRLEQGVQKADEDDLSMFSSAGRRGQQALKLLQQHPEWLTEPRLLYAWQGNMHSKAASEAGSKMLRERIKQRADSASPPEDWWQTEHHNNNYRVSACLLSKADCTVWAMDLNGDGQPEVLLFNREKHQIVVYAHYQDRWGEVGVIAAAVSNTVFEQAVKQGKLNSVEKPWRDLEIDGQRYPVEYQYQHEALK